MSKLSDLIERVDLLAAAVGADIKATATALQAAINGRVPSARTLTAGTGLTGGGDLSANRTLAADFGTGAGKVCQGNDSRLSDARTPTVHTHDDRYYTEAEINVLLPVKITQAAYDALGPGRPARLYAIVG